MLEEQINGFIEYCKVSGFRDKSIESLSIRLNQFKKFLITARLRKIKSITYRHLSGFVADYKNPSIHVKKARVWSLRQFFHYLKLNGYVNENIATDLPYPKIEKTVPHFFYQNMENGYHQGHCRISFAMLPTASALTNTFTPIFSVIPPQLI